MGLPDPVAMSQILVGIAAWLVQLVVALALSIGAIYMGIRMFDKMTKNINEWKELKKGNVAIGLILATVVYCIASVVGVGVSNLTTGVQGAVGVTGALVALLVGVLNLLISIGAAVASIYIAIYVLDKITVEIDEQKELAKGNLAVAVLVSGVILAVTNVIMSSVPVITKVLNSQTIISALGLG
jgi:uncharacterized membrane protein YjfL (UPF0719 family)